LIARSGCAAGILASGFSAVKNCGYKTGSPFIINTLTQNRSQVFHELFSTAC
jgi:hypothetical protein